MMLHYNLFCLEDAALRRRLFDDMTQDGHGIGPTDLPGFLEKVDQLLSDAYTFRCRVEDAVEDIKSDLRRLEDVMHDFHLYPEGEARPRATILFESIERSLNYDNTEQH